jgi:hypothetical protein
MRPYAPDASEQTDVLLNGRNLTKTAMRVLDERRTTRRREMMRLTVTPTWTLQMIVRKKVRLMSVMSIHARILRSQFNVII